MPLWTSIVIPPVLWMAQGGLGWLIATRACPPATGTISIGTARLLIAMLTAIALAGTTIAVASARRRIAGHDDEARYLSLVLLVLGVTLSLGLCLAGLPTLFLLACGETR